MADTGQRVGDYEVMAPLGAGGMGRVYKVRNVISNREEAMKILLPDFAADPDLAARFMAEIRTLAGLEHPGIAQLRTAFQHNNQFVMVMEYVEGTTLEKLASQVRIPLDHVLDYSMQVLAALRYAHGRGVIHRDIKPANIMITTYGMTKLMDFGIAKSTGENQLTRPGSTIGSVYYMSPEQVRGGTVDARSDLYSFGVTLYEMLTGRKPFQADTSYTILNAQVNQPPTPPIEINPGIPPALNEIVLRALAKNPDDRFQTADEFRNVLRAQVEPHAVAQPSASVWSEPQRASQPPVFETQPLSSASEAQYDAPAPPPFTPVTPAAAPLIAPASPRRGLWIGLGAVTAILALAAVAWVLPRVYSTHASQKPRVAPSTEAPATPATTTPVPPSATPVTPTETPASSEQPQTPAVEPQTPAQSDTSAPAGGQAKPERHKPGSGIHAAVGSGSQPAEKTPDVQAPAATSGGSARSGSAEPQAEGPSPREVREARDRFANLEARADAALAGVEQIRSQQREQGLDIRADILGAMNRLHHQLDEARKAMGQKDLETANEYMNRADGETARLEKFLGR